MSTQTNYFLFSVALLAPAPAFADEPALHFEKFHLAAAEDARAQGDAWKRWAEEFSRDLRSSMGTMFGARLGTGKVVKGAPYSAEIVTEANQSLADGNVITRKQRGAIYRDGEGRTRQELPGDGKDPSVFIFDPVENQNTVLTPGRKRAVISPGVRDGSPYDRQKIVINQKDRQVLSVNGQEIRVENGRVTIDGKEVADGKDIDVTSRNGKRIKVENGKVTIDGKDVAEIAKDKADRVVVKTITSVDSPDGTKREEVRVQVVRGSDGYMHPMPVPPMPPVPPAPPAPGVHPVPPVPPVPPLPPMPGVQGMRFESVAKLGKGVTTSLGTKDIEGVKAEGKSTVWTIPAGEIGNRNPINVTSESWYSPDLQVTVLSRYNDPRTGESIFRLASIKRGEPSPDLFKVPEDYRARTKPGPNPRANPEPRPREGRER